MGIIGIIGDEAAGACDGCWFGPSTATSGVPDKGAPVGAVVAESPFSGEPGAVTSAAGCPPVGPVTWAGASGTVGGIPAWAGASGTLGDIPAWAPGDGARFAGAACPRSSPDPVASGCGLCGARATGAGPLPEAIGRTVAADPAGNGPKAPGFPARPPRRES
jgi:hypothetical protein